MTAEERAEMMQSVENSTKLLNEIMEEIGQTLFVENAAAYLAEEAVDVTESEAIRNAVLKRIDFLDANFLASLNIYVRVMQSREEPQLLATLMAVRDEVMRQVSQRLPPAARVLDLILFHHEKKRREDIMRTTLGGGAGHIPAVSADSLITAASQFVDDMEEQAIIVDRPLLARLCLAREELRALDLAAGFTGDSGEAHQPSLAATYQRGNVPQRCAIFLKELVKVSEPARRVALLTKALETDWEGAAPRAASNVTGQPDYVRPGRLLGTLQAMQAQLNLNPVDANLGVLQRLEMIKAEVMAVLDRMQMPQGATGG